MKEIIEDYTDVLVGVAMAVAVTVMLCFAVTAYKEILYGVIRACLG